ncbi:MAG: glycosyltransferase family 1 protein [Bacteroidetes bacterium]|nr:glycosyltransferase family 1 protein [Bacteroidota bacterium]
MLPLSDISEHAPVAGRRIALFAGAYNHISDGVALTLNRLVQYLEDRGAEVLIFAPTSNKPPALEHNGTLISIPSIPFPGRPDYRLTIGISRKGWNRLDAFEPHIVHIATPDYAGAQALKWAKSQKVPVVSSYHTHFASYFKYFASYNPLYQLDILENTAWRYGRWFYSQVEHVYVPSPSIADKLRQQGITKGLRIWARGVNPKAFNPLRRSQSWRSSHGFKDNDLVVAYVGRLVWEKNLSVFAQVLKRLNAQGIPYKSLVVGDGPARDALCEQLPDTVFTGPLEGNELATAYASSDIFLFPSDTETFGNVTLEAMASGLPAVCANASGSDLLVVDGETGYLVPAHDITAFASSIERLVSDPHLRQQFGTAARERAMAFEWNNVMGNLAHYYQEILKGSTESDRLPSVSDGMDMSYMKAVA